MQEQVLSPKSTLLMQDENKNQIHMLKQQTIEQQQQQQQQQQLNQTEHIKYENDVDGGILTNMHTAVVETANSTIKLADYRLLQATYNEETESQHQQSQQQQQQQLEQELEQNTIAKTTTATLEPPIEQLNFQQPYDYTIRKSESDLDITSSIIPASVNGIIEQEEPLSLVSHACDANEIAPIATAETAESQHPLDLFYSSQSRCLQQQQQQHQQHQQQKRLDMLQMFSNNQNNNNGNSYNNNNSSSNNNNHHNANNCTKRNLNGDHFLTSSLGMLSPTSSDRSSSSSSSSSYNNNNNNNHININHNNSNHNNNNNVNKTKSEHKHNSDVFLAPQPPPPTNSFAIPAAVSSPNNNNAGNTTTNPYDFFAAAAVASMFSPNVRTHATATGRSTPSFEWMGSNSISAADSADNERAASVPPQPMVADARNPMADFYHYGHDLFAQQQQEQQRRWLQCLQQQQDEADRQQQRERERELRQRQREVEKQELQRRKAQKLREQQRFIERRREMQLEQQHQRQREQQQQQCTSAAAAADLMSLFAASSAAAAAAALQQPLQRPLRSASTMSATYLGNSTERQQRLNYAAGSNASHHRRSATPAPDVFQSPLTPGVNAANAAYHLPSPHLAMAAAAAAVAAGAPGLHASNFYTPTPTPPTSPWLHAWFAGGDNL